MASMPGSRNSIRRLTMSRATVKQEYQVILRFPGGSERTWTVTDCYFDRRMEKIQREMLAQIRDNDRDTEFSLDQKPDPLKTYEIVLINIENMQRRSWIGTSSTRYDAVDRAFRDLTGKSQADNLETWKVLQAQELS
jgi:hypothetical protein